MRALLLLSLAQTLGPTTTTTTSTDFPEFRPEELATTLALTAGIAGLTLLIPTPPKGWQQGLLFDDAILDASVASTKETRDQISLVSDLLQDGIVAAPILMDVLGTALIAQGDAELAGQLALIDLESFMIAAAAIMLTKRTVGRVRPTIEVCPNTGDFSCRSNASRRSILSGHATASFTGAGLICAHHHFLKLWGGRADDGACLGALALATGAAMLRVPSGRHYPTDVLAGAAVGLLAGYVAPYVLHFARPRADPNEPITGAATLGATFGVLSEGGEHHVLGGMDLTLAHRYWLTPEPELALTAAIDGRLYRADGDIAFRQLSMRSGLWYSGAETAFVVDYRSTVRRDESENVLAGGLQIAFSLPGEALAPRLTLRWLPLLAGDTGFVVGRLDVAFARWIALRAEVQNIVGGNGSTLATLALGGRLPW